MKKIISGMIYNLFKSFEIWALLILVLLTSALYDFRCLRELDCVNANVFGETITYNEDDIEYDTVIITPDNVSQYTFQGSGISECDAQNIIWIHTIFDQPAYTGNQNMCFSCTGTSQAQNSLTI